MQLEPSARRAPRSSCRRSPGCSPLPSPVSVIVAFRVRLADSVPICSVPCTTTYRDVSARSIVGEKVSEPLIVRLPSAGVSMSSSTFLLGGNHHIGACGRHRAAPRRRIRPLRIHGRRRISAVARVRFRHRRARAEREERDNGNCSVECTERLHTDLVMRGRFYPRHCHCDDLGNSTDHGGKNGAIRYCRSAALHARPRLSKPFDSLRLPHTLSTAATPSAAPALPSPSFPPAPAPRCRSASSPSAPADPRSILRAGRPIPRSFGYAIRQRLAG